MRKNSIPNKSVKKEVRHSKEPQKEEEIVRHFHPEDSKNFQGFKIEKTLNVLRLIFIFPALFISYKLAQDFIYRGKFIDELIANISSYLDNYSDMISHSPSNLVENNLKIIELIMLVYSRLDPEKNSEKIQHLFIEHDVFSRTLEASLLLTNYFANDTSISDVNNMLVSLLLKFALQSAYVIEDFSCFEEDLQEIILKAPTHEISEAALSLSYLLLSPDSQTKDDDNEICLIKDPQSFFEIIGKSNFSYLWFDFADEFHRKLVLNMKFNIENEQDFLCEFLEQASVTSLEWNQTITTSFCHFYHAMRCNSIDELESSICYL